MSKSSVHSVIRLRGVRQNNLKNFDLDVPCHRLVVVTGLSGSGKSSLAFDTLFAEGQRRYIETFSPYARQFFDRMDKPQVDTIEGIPPAIAIEQRNAVKSTRSTVGTMTEICDYLKLLWPAVAQLYCRQCGRPVREETPKQIWETLTHAGGSREASVPPEDARVGIGEAMVTFDLPLSEKLSLDESLALVAKQGYQRALWENEVIRLEEISARAGAKAPASLTIIQDRVKLAPEQRPRFVEACEQAFHFGKGKLAIREVDGSSPRRFSNRRHCATCDLDYREPSAALFSFNNPVGACPSCRGFGRVITIDYRRAIPDRAKSLADGAIKPWQVGHGLESQKDLLKFCKPRKIPIHVPFQDLPASAQEWVIQGDPGYGKDAEHQWPRAWYGLKGYFRWLESKAYKMHVRVLLSRYRAYASCPACRGQRLQPDALLYRAELPADLRRGGAERDLRVTLSDFYQLPIRDALRFIDQLASARGDKRADPLALIFDEALARLRYLSEVGLGYLTLDRPTRSLSGGETERVNLTTCLGTRLVNSLFVLDEPSVGLHPRDTERLIGILERLRDAGNTVVVVEHEASVMRAADQIIDLGPGHGEAGGQIVAQGNFAEIARSPASLTGQYLSGQREIAIPTRRPVNPATSGPWPASAREPLTLNESMATAPPRPSARTSERASLGAAVSSKAPRPEAPPGFLRLINASRNNLRGLTLDIPLGRLVCITGVSGSGKSTLVREVLLPALEEKLGLPGSGTGALDDEDAEDESEAPDADTGGPTSVIGAESLKRVVLVDQSPLGKTPRSNPVVYTGAFDDLRELFAQTEAARRRGLNASAFSFNSPQGQCERCRGAGFEKIEMQFLSDIFIRCSECEGRRYRPHILEVKVSPPGAGGPATPSWSIADLLAATVDEVAAFVAGFPESRAAGRAAKALRLLQEVGLGYLRAGQAINTLSGGECQRLKLARHLTEWAADGLSGRASAADAEIEPALFLFDEPTTGLHFEDVRVLLLVFQRLVAAGHSALVVEHNLDVIKSADWVIDLGPDAGDEGGQLVAQGTPETIAACRESHTGRALRALGL